MGSDDRLQFRLPRQRREERIDQPARHHEEVGQSFLDERIQDEVGT